MGLAPNTQNQKLQADLLYATFRILMEKGGELPVKFLLDELSTHVYLDEWATERYHSGQIRWKALLHWASHYCVKLGLLEKTGGIWKLTESGAEKAGLEKISLYEYVFGGDRRRKLMEAELEPPFALSAARFGTILEYKLLQSLDYFSMFRAARANVHPKPKYHIREVLFGTDRGKLSSENKAVFGSDRSDIIHYGKCHVSIPFGHNLGAVERPDWKRFELRAIPEKHVVLLEVETSTRKEFFLEVVNRITESDKKQAFVFIHGYNVSFEDAALRTAQVSHDLQFKGAPVFFSWPSSGTVSGYTHDETKIDWASRDIKNFLKDFAENSSAEKIYLIGHSMGNRGLTRALQELIVESPTLVSRIAEIILTAPDIDSEIFKRDIAPALTVANTPVTLYASSEDKALLASKKIHGEHRAGDTSGGVLVMPGVETIDATGVDTSFLGHSYFSGTRTVLSDIFYLIGHGTRAAGRFGLVKVAAETTQHYWKFAPQKK